MVNDSPETVWVVVKVERGIPVIAEVYNDRETALLREQALRNSCFNPNDDETEVFKTPIIYKQTAFMES